MSNGNRWENFTNKEVEELENGLYISYNEDAELEIEEAKKLREEFHQELIRRGLRDPDPEDK